MLSKLFGADMVKRRSGRILNVASTAAFQAGPLMSTYYASKAYVLLFSEGIGNELAQDGVDVSVLCPGPTNTGFGERAIINHTKILNVPWMMNATEVAEIGFAGFTLGRDMATKPGRPLKSIMVMLGPEGGFTEREIEMARQSGFVTAGMGPRILRAETATLAASTLIQYLYGDMGPIEDQLE